MEFFIGIVPPKEVSDKIKNLRESFGFYKKVEPHITVKAQSGLTEDMV